jgi:5-dehydro-2-deoxygluconokinase
VIPPKLDGAPNAPDTVYRALKRLYNIGIYPEWWKLEPMDAAQWREVDALIAERDPYCRGVVLLGLSAPVEQLEEGFRSATHSRTCRGFTVGRTIFYEPSFAWLAGEIGDDELIARVRRTFEGLIAAWRASRANAGTPAAAPLAHEEKAA